LFRRAGRAGTSKVYVDISGRRAIISAKRIAAGGDRPMHPDQAVINGMFMPGSVEQRYASRFNGQWRF
jgi:hypothetical protein